MALSSAIRTVPAHGSYSINAGKSQKRKEGNTEYGLNMKLVKPRGFKLAQISVGSQGQTTSKLHPISTLNMGLQMSQFSFPHAGAVTCQPSFVLLREHELLWGKSLRQMRTFGEVKKYRKWHVPTMMIVARLG